jgi:hypothetical protein
MESRNSYEIGIKSMPSLLIFKDGKGIARTVGSSSKEAYQKLWNNLYQNIEKKDIEKR